MEAESPAASEAGVRKPISSRERAALEPMRRVAHGSGRREDRVHACRLGNGCRQAPLADDMLKPQSSKVTWRVCGHLDHQISWKSMHRTDELSVAGQVCVDAVQQAERVATGRRERRRRLEEGVGALLLHTHARAQGRE